MKTKIDMSAEAITRRLKMASEMRDLCLSLARAGESLKSTPKKSKPKAKK